MYLELIYSLYLLFLPSRSLSLSLSVCPLSTTTRLFLLLSSQSPPIPHDHPSLPQGPQLPPPPLVHHITTHRVGVAYSCYILS